MINLAIHHLRLYKDILEGRYTPSNPAINIDEASMAIRELEEFHNEVMELIGSLQWFIDDENDSGGSAFYYDDEGRGENFNDSGMFDSAEELFKSFEKLKKYMKVD